MSSRAFDAVLTILRCELDAVAEASRLARALGDVSAVRKGKVGRRLTRRVTGRATGRLLGKLFR